MTDDAQPVLGRRVRFAVAVGTAAATFAGAQWGLVPRLGVPTGAEAAPATLRTDLYAGPSGAPARTQAQPAGSSTSPTGTASGDASRLAPVTGLRLEAVEGTATVRWDGPRPTGVRTVVELRDGPDGRVLDTCRTAQSSCSFTGLVDGATYTATARRVSVRTTAPPSPTVSSSAVSSPALLGSGTTLLWLDAGQPESLLTQAGRPARLGESVTTWRDRSRLRRDATTGPERAPTLGRIGSHTALSFDGSSALAVTAAGLPVDDAPATVLAVALADRGADRRAVCPGIFTWGLPEAGRGRFVQRACSDYPAHAGVLWGSEKTPSRAPWPAAVPVLVVATFLPGDVTVELNGRQASLWRRPAAEPFDTATASGAVVGGTWHPDSVWDGRIGEIVVLSGAATGPEATTVADYLRRKWRIGKPMPAGEIVPGPAAAG